MVFKIYTKLLARNLSKNLTKALKNYSTTSSNVITEEIGDKAVITLNRPTVLNALDKDLVLELLSTLKKSEGTKSLIILKGAGGRAFSAGGDIIQLTNAVKRNDNAIVADTIIHLNCCIYLIYRYKLPVVAILDGITYGGGAGLSAFATHRIATERTRFSMPETKIGFHPNSAATYFFNRTRGKLGYYLALTSNSLEGTDVLKAGFATHFCQSKNVKTLEEEILKCSRKEDVKGVIDDVCEKQVPEFSLAHLIDRIDRCFSAPTVEEILAKLKEDGSDWAKETVDKITKHSPTSLKVTLRQLQKGKDMNLIDALAMESCLTVNFHTFPDLSEGVRVALRDRHRTPEWSPPRLEDVTEELIEEHFAPTYEAKQRKLLQEISC